jgi:hypothetical protein
LVCLALPAYLRAHGKYTAGAKVLSWFACLAMILALVGNIYPVPEGPYGRLPYIYLGYLLAGMLWFLLRPREKKLAG